MKDLNEHIEFLEMTEDEPQLLCWLLELRRHREDNWKQRAEAAESLNTHLELAVRKAEGVSESLRRRAEDAENKLLFTRPAPAVRLAELVSVDWSEEKEPCEEIRYNHVTAETPLGLFSIEWKGWKDYDSRDLYLNGEYIGSFHNVDDAKQGAADYLLNLTKSLLRDIEEAK